MMRNHSFLAAVKSICHWNAKRDVIQIGLIGAQNIGKSTLSRTIAHEFHKQMYSIYGLQYTVLIFGENELAKLAEIVKALPVANYVMIFQDISFLQGKLSSKDIARIKMEKTKIRHLHEGQDVKILMIDEYHYSKGLDKYLRQGNFFFYLDVGTSERDNVLDALGRKNARKIKAFTDHLFEATDKGEWTVSVSKTQKVTYKYQDPFIPVLFYNTKQVREIVTPTRFFLDEHCTICSNADNDTNNALDIDAFIEAGSKQFGESLFRTSLQTVLLQHGLNTLMPKKANAINFILKAMAKNNISYTQLMTAMNFQLNNSTLKSEYKNFENKITILSTAHNSKHEKINGNEKTQKDA